MEALSEVVRQGKARYLGFSEWTPAQIQAALDLPGVERFVSSQPEYSLLHREPERGRLPDLRCQRHLADRLVAARPGRAHRQVQGRSPAARRVPGPFGPHGLGDRALSRARDRVGGRALRPIADGLGVTLSQLALAWVLREPNVAVGDRRRQPSRAAARERGSGGCEARRGDAGRDRRRRSPASPRKAQPRARMVDRQFSAARMAARDIGATAAARPRAYLPIRRCGDQRQRLGLGHPRIDANYRSTI